MLVVIGSEERVRKGADKLIKMMNAKQQGRLDGFFKVQSKGDEKGKAPKPNAGSKRKVLWMLIGKLFWVV